MTNVKKNPWERTTDEFFVADTPILYDPFNTDKDYAGQLVFIRTDGEVKDKLLACEPVDWDYFMLPGDLPCRLYVERRSAGTNTDFESVIFYQVPAEAKILSATTQEYIKFTKWRQTVPELTYEDQLKKFGEYHGILGPMGSNGNVIQFYDTEVFKQGLVYPIQRRALVEEAIKQNFYVPTQVVREALYDPYSHDLENEYAFPGYDFTVTLKTGVYAKSPEEAFDESIRYFNSTGMPSFECQVTNNTTGHMKDMDPEGFKNQPLSQAVDQEIYSTKQMLVHSHEGGPSIYKFVSTFPAGKQPSPHMIARMLSLDFEPHRAECFEIEDLNNEGCLDLRDLVTEFMEDQIDIDWTLRAVEDEDAPEYWKVVDPDDWTIKTWFSSKKDAQDWADEEMGKLGISNEPSVKEENETGKPVAHTEIVTRLNFAFSYPENLPANHILIRGRNAEGDTVIEAPFHVEELEAALGKATAQEFFEFTFFDFNDVQIPCDPENVILGNAESKAVVGKIEASRFIECRPMDDSFKIDAYTQSGRWLFGELHYDRDLPGTFGQDLAGKMIANNGGTYTDLNLRITPTMLNEDPEEAIQMVPGA